MRALYLDRVLTLRRDYPDPRAVAGEAVVKVRLAGICGTDLELISGYMAYRGVLGHEFVGEVVVTAGNGSGTGASEGAELAQRRVVGEINVGCGRCHACRADLERHCPNRTVLGVLGRDGSFAEYLCLPPRNLLPVPDSVPDEMAVFCEPVAAACEILEQVKFDGRETIAVLGDGRLGAVVAMVLAAEGLNPVLAGRHPEKLARLGELGLRTNLENKMEPGFDVVVDCTGNPAGFERAVALTRPRGRIVLKSTTASGGNLNLAPIVIEEVTVVGSRCGRFEPALKLLASGKVDPRPLISAVYSLDQGIEAMAASREPPNFKILLRP